jgi:hypothetical protein
MPDLFGLDIAGIVNDALEEAGGVLSGVLIKVAPGSRTSGSLTSGTNPTETPHSFKGFYDNRQLSRLPETRVQQGDRAVLLLGASISGGVEPEPGDKITMEGETTSVQSIIERDPAAATYIVQTRAS